jgi:hypothetical protein
MGLGIAPDVTGLGRIFADGRIDWFSMELGVDAALPVTRDESGGSAFKLNRFAAVLRRAATSRRSLDA